MHPTAVGVDLAKYTFSVCQMDAQGHVLHRRDLRRKAFAAWLAQLPPGTVVAMEACSGAHYWARYCRELGLEPQLIAAQFVTPFRKSARARTTANAGSPDPGQIEQCIQPSQRSTAPLR